MSYVPPTHPPYTLPDLPYGYNALEPHISGKIMELHHRKHHQAYVDALNAAEKSYITAPTVKERIALQAAIRFNGGGHINHSLFWTNLAPSAVQSKEGIGGNPDKGPSLKRAIVETFGSFEAFKEEFNTAAKGIQGSGWCWLGLAKNKTVEIVTTANQDPLVSHVPLFGVDVWEHAYYLDYENRRPEYLNAIWNVINFAEAEARYTKAIGGGRL